MAIESLKLLPNKYQLTIVGDGEIRAQLEKLASDLGILKRIRFEGAKTEVVKYYNDSHLFLLPSVYEPFGQTILEASSCGLPTVAFNQNIVNTATRDILGELGCYAEELSPKCFADTIEQAYKDYYMSKLKSRVKLRNLVIDKYSWTNTYNTIKGQKLK